MNHPFLQQKNHQENKDEGSSCWCLEAVETSFPEDKRIEYAKKSLDDSLLWLKSINVNQPACSDVTYCNRPLKASPAGTAAGFW